MVINNIKQTHSVSELILSHVNNWCAKHNEKPEFCGATKEARKLASNVMKVTGTLLFVIALAKTASK